MGGPTTVDNCSLLCQAHNAYRARQVFGDENIEGKIAEARARRAEADAPAPAPAPAHSAREAQRGVHDKAALALEHIGFKRSDARRAVEKVRAQEVEPRLELVFRAALAVLTQ